MPTTSLGRLEPLDPRTAWPSESANFTPWLAEEENIRLLGNALDLELEVVGVERGVGRYAADIVCRDTASGGYVLIENQLEQSDHSHLGQVLTYCAGLSGAGEEVTVAVWIARRFTEEHRAALDWLNEISTDRFQFFGLELELWRIGDSAPAPKFNIVSKPNEWSRAVSEGVVRRDGDSLSDKRKLQLDYWTAFREHLRSKQSILKPQKPQPQSWMTLSLGRANFTLEAVASDYDLAEQQFAGEQIRAMVSITSTDADALFQALCAQKDEIEAEFGEGLEWYRPEGTRARRVYLKSPAKLTVREQWPSQHEWLRSRLERMHRVFAPRVKHLKPLVGVGSDSADEDSPSS